MSIVLLSLGSNLGNRVKNIFDGVHKIAEKVGKVISYSPLYESKAWGNESPNDYINACILVETDLLPEEVIHTLHIIEKELGRIRNEQYSDRTLDIDILLFDQLILETENLIIPHPRMHQRLFVLVPANQIVPMLVHPVFKKSIQELLLECSDESNVYEFKLTQD